MRFWPRDRCRFAQIVVVRTLSQEYGEASAVSAPNSVKRMYAIRRLIIPFIAFSGAVLLGAIASVLRAQETPSADQQEIQRRQQEYGDRLSHSRLVGADDALAIEMPGGELLALSRRAGCLPPVAKAGVIKIDCTLHDGPAHYFDESTRLMIESCSFWFPDAKRCPPKQWPVEVEGCDGKVPQSIEGTWRLYAMTATDYYAVSDGWEMTLDQGSVVFDFDGFPRVTRPYAITESGTDRYRLEIKDAMAATTAIDVEFSSCGMFVESEARCDSFCSNVTRELGRPTEDQFRAAVAKSLGGVADEAALERIVKELATAEPGPLFPERAYFLLVGAD
jgi:hypothetical protein